jgi:hypothetical protein
VPEVEDTPWLSRRGHRIDFARRDAFKRHLGELGEQFAVEPKKQRLGSTGRDVSGTVFSGPQVNWLHSGDQEPDGP